MTYQFQTFARQNEARNHRPDLRDESSAHLTRMAIPVVGCGLAIDRLIGPMVLPSPTFPVSGS